MAKKKQKWIKFRHRFWWAFANTILKPYIRLTYRAKIEKFKAEKGKQYLVVFNHQTAFDQFFVGISFKKPVYYVASEDLFSNGFISKFLRWAVAPIPIKKQATDPRAVMNCMRVKREGGTIALSPEGNRTYSGKTEYMKPAIVALAKALKMPIAFYRIEGGYGVQPRWSNCNRKGKMRCYVSKVMEVEEVQALSNEELFDVMQKELYVNEAVADGEYRHKRLAENLERSAYWCPDCGLSTFESEKDIITCKKCGKQIRYLPTKELVGVNCEFPYPFYNDWYEAQSAFINGLDVTKLVDQPLYCEQARFSEVILYKNKKLIDENAKIALFGDRVEIEANGEVMKMPFEEVAVATVLGRNKLNFYFDGKVYQLKGTHILTR